MDFERERERDVAGAEFKYWPDEPEGCFFWFWGRTGDESGGEANHISHVPP